MTAEAALKCEWLTEGTTKSPEKLRNLKQKDSTKKMLDNVADF